MLTHNTSKSACTQYVGQDMVCGYIQTKWRERTYLIMLGTDGQEPLPAAWLLLRLYVMSCRRIIQQSCDSMRGALQHRVSPLTSHTPAFTKPKTTSSSACNSLLAQKIILLQRTVSQRSTKMLALQKL